MSCGDSSGYSRKKESAVYYKWVADKIKPVRRLTSSSWHHHQIVASLEPKEQDKWLDIAEKEGLSVHLSHKTVKDLRYTASNVEASRRRDAVPFYHHKVAKALGQPNDPISKSLLCTEC